MSQQGSFELHHIYIYIPMQSQPYNILRAKHFFLRETRTFELERECEIYHSRELYCHLVELDGIGAYQPDGFKHALSAKRLTHTDAFCRRPPLICPLNLG